jgi:hypothetical protein
MVTVDDLLTVIDIALGHLPPSLCPLGNTNGDDQITVDEILVAVNNALSSCPGAVAGGMAMPVGSRDGTSVPMRRPSAGSRVRVMLPAEASNPSLS